MNKSLVKSEFKRKKKTKINNKTQTQAHIDKGITSWTKRKQFPNTQIQTTTKYMIKFNLKW